MSDLQNHRPNIAKLHQRMMGDERGFFHSHAYAHAARGQKFGAVDSSSFEQRRQIERNRHAVGSYRDAMISNIPEPEARPDLDPGVTRATRIAMPMRRSSAQLPRTSFREPPARHYNPYT